MGVQLNIKVSICVISIILAFAMATDDDYELQCETEEIGILWPNYRDNTAYYFCPRLREKQITMRCDAGKVFCFVLQLCVDHNEYIPPPPLKYLPTAKPTALGTTSVPLSSSNKPSGPTFPTPKYPTGSSRVPLPTATPPPPPSPPGPTTKPSSGVPTPPTQSTPPTYTKPPGPPSPPIAGGVPMPPTPKPTPPTLNLTPPGPPMPPIPLRP